MSLWLQCEQDRMLKSASNMGVVVTRIVIIQPLCSVWMMNRRWAEVFTVLLRSAGLNETMVRRWGGSGRPRFSSNRAPIRDTPSLIHHRHSTQPAATCMRWLVVPGPSLPVSERSASPLSLWCYTVSRRVGLSVCFLTRPPPLLHFDNNKLHSAQQNRYCRCLSSHLPSPGGCFR